MQGQILWMERWYSLGGSSGLSSQISTLTGSKMHVSKLPVQDSLCAAQRASDNSYRALTMSPGFLLIGNDRLFFVQDFYCLPSEPNNYYSGIFWLRMLFTSSPINLRQDCQAWPLFAFSGYLCGSFQSSCLEEQSTYSVTYSLRIKVVHWTSSAENHHTNISVGLNSTSPCAVFSDSINWWSYN